MSTANILQKNQKNLRKIKKNKKNSKFLFIRDYIAKNLDILNYIKSYISWVSGGNMLPLQNYKTSRKIVDSYLIRKRIIDLVGKFL